MLIFTRLNYLWHLSLVWVKLKNYMKIDVLYCVEKRDINSILEQSIKCCIDNFELLNDIYVVTNDINRMSDFVHAGKFNAQVYVINENDIIADKDIKGWYKQQLIKLNAYQICKTEYICCLGSDALVLNHVGYDDLFYNNEQILYYNRYPFNQNHLEYERKRIENLANVFHITQTKSYLLGDFIMELMIFKKQYLIELTEYICRQYVSLENMVKRFQCQSLFDKVSFGEWTLYAMFLLDVKQEKVAVRNSKSLFVEQLHSMKDCDLHNKEAKVVHFVNKELSYEMIKSVTGITLSR